MNLSFISHPFPVGSSSVESWSLAWWVNAEQAYSWYSPLVQDSCTSPEGKYRTPALLLKGQFLRAKDRRLWGNRLNVFGDLNCGSEAVLLWLSLPRGQKRGTLSLGKEWPSKKGDLKEHSLTCFLEGPLFLQADLPSSSSHSVDLPFYLAKASQNTHTLCFFPGR